MILARCGVAKKRAKLLRTSLYASSLALFLLLARRQNHCAKLLSATKAFFAFYSKKSVSSLFLLLLSLTNCKIIAPNRLTFPKFFPAFQEKILLLSLLLQIKKSLKKRTKLLRTSLYASSLALFLLLARRQNHCAKLLKKK